VAVSVVKGSKVVEVWGLFIRGLLTKYERRLVCP